MAFDTPPNITQLRLPGWRLAAALALAGIFALPAAARSATRPANPGQARAVPASPAPAPIVCTKLGCKPLPRGCHAETQFTWDGDPTGYQIIVCP